jgi:hypothetical protein
MGDTAGCKLDIVVDRYDLDDSVVQYDTVDERMLDRWQGTGNQDPDGYRTITEWFNRTLLRTVYDDTGRDTTGTRVQSDYDALTGEDQILRAEVSDSLAEDGIDADRLLSDMVSWSTVRHHLNECLDGEKPRQRSETEWERNSVQISQEHAKSKAEEAIRSLVSKGDLETSAPVDIDIQVLVSCQECPTRLPFEAAVERGFVCKDH